MGLTVQVALVPDGVALDPAELTRVAAALSRQVERDFAPVWGVEATVDPFTRLQDVPLDAWPLIIKKNVQDAAGYHDDKDGQPFALIEFEPDWSLTASHECLEMLADPFGRRLKAGNLPDQAAQLGLKGSRVRFLVEVCDPSEGGQFAYQINGVLVSDFYTPRYFDPVKAAGVQYSFTGMITAPRTVLDGGYISWQNLSTRHWMQLRMFPDDSSPHVPHVIDLNTETVFGKLIETHSIRSAIDKVTRPPKYQRSLQGEKRRASDANRDHAATAQAARGADLRKDVSSLLGGAPKPRAKGNRPG